MRLSTEQAQCLGLEGKLLVATMLCGLYLLCGWTAYCARRTCHGLVFICYLLLLMCRNGHPGNAGDSHCM